MLASATRVDVIGRIGGGKRGAHVLVSSFGRSASQAAHRLSPAGRKPVSRAPDGQPRVLRPRVAALSPSAAHRIISSRLLQKLRMARGSTIRACGCGTSPRTACRSKRVPRSTAAPCSSIADVAMSYVQPTTTDRFFYRNAEGDELVYVAEGTGVLETKMGDLSYQAGRLRDHPPRHHAPLELADKPPRMLVIESAGQVRPPARYVQRGRASSSSTAPIASATSAGRRRCSRTTRRASFRLVVKQYNALTEVMLDHHPFDVVGWDGYYYPWALSIHDFEPIVGSLHQPPPVHQTFQGDGFVVCSFVPRLFDFHPDAVPVPYNHSNVNSDEVMYYANNEFMSRKGIAYGSLTLHPGRPAARSASGPR